MGPLDGLEPRLAQELEIDSLLMSLFWLLHCHQNEQ